MKNDTNITVSIGIPCFNESRNIGRLLESLINQETNTIKIEKIIVWSDGSSDDTALVTNKFRSNIVDVIPSRERMGKALVQNEIFKISNSEYIVILDADITIKNHFLIEKFISSSYRRKLDLSSGEIKESTPTNLISKILFTGMEFKRNSYNKFLNGNNIFTCHGPIRAFSYKLYKKIIFPQASGEDIYSFLFVKRNNLTYGFVPEAEVYYELSRNLNDHLNQSLRFKKALLYHYKLFGKNFVNKYLSLDKKTLLLNILNMFKRDPLYFSLYIILLSYSQILTVLQHNAGNSGIWKISESTK